MRRTSSARRESYGRRNRALDFKTYAAAGARDGHTGRWRTITTPGGMPRGLTTMRETAQSLKRSESRADDHLSRDGGRADA